MPAATDGPVATHVGYWVRDLDEALDFYQNTLGWELVWILPDEIAMLSVDGEFMVGLLSVKRWWPEWEDEDSLPSPQLALMTMDIEAEADKLRASGVEVIEIDETPEVTVMAFSDNNGNWYTLYQPGHEMDGEHPEGAEHPQAGESANEDDHEHEHDHE